MSGKCFGMKPDNTRAYTLMNIIMVRSTSGNVVTLNET